MAIEIRRVSDGRAEISLGEELRHKGRLWFRSCAGRDWVASRRLGTPCARWISHFSDLLFISLFSEGWTTGFPAESRPFGRKKIELR